MIVSGALAHMWHGSDSSTQKSSCVSQGTKFWEALPRDTASHMENGKILEKWEKPLNNSNSAVATLTSRLDSEKNPVELEVRNRNLLYQLPRIHLRLRLAWHWQNDKTLVKLSQFIADIADLFLSWICRRVPHLPGSRRLMQIIRLYLLMQLLY